VAPFTSDGDLALNPNVLEDEPLLAEALSAAGFSLAVTPGTWARSDVQIDLMVPTSLSGPRRRSARLGAHGTEVARKAKGLEAALIDNSVFTLTALDASDTRAIDVAVAGLSALLVAKLHKLAERKDTPSRWAPKDGLDILRILQAGDLRQLGATLVGLERHVVAGPVTQEARLYLRQLFGTQTAHGVAMAVRASVGVEDAATIAGAYVCESPGDAWREHEAGAGAFGACGHQDDHALRPPQSRSVARGRDAAGLTSQRHMDGT
jgi:hypothetical protein